MKQRIAHTYSIVAIDREHGEMGVGVQSHYFAVGATVPWCEPGVGVVATQSVVRVQLGPDGLSMMKTGRSPVEALKALLVGDESAEYRQVALLDAAGRIAVHTGSTCIPEAGHRLGDTYSAQANMMLNPTVPQAMGTSFESSTGTLAERILASLEAAEAEGGDIRGRQSAAIVVVRTEPSGDIALDKPLDLRVDDHPDPLAEIGRLLRLKKAFGYVDLADEALGRHDEEAALELYARAESLYPESTELRYWHALSLISLGNVDDGLRKLAPIFAEAPNWLELTERLPRTGLFDFDEDLLRRLRNLTG